MQRSALAQSIARILRRTACRQQLTQRQVAIRAGVHPRTVGRLFRGRTFDLATAERVAGVLRVDLAAAIDRLEEE